MTCPKDAPGTWGRFLLLCLHMNEKPFEQQPSAEEAEQAKLIKQIEGANSALELAEVVYDSGNTEMIRAYHETRLDFLKKVMPETMSEYKDVDEEGFLVKKSLEKLTDEERDEVERHAPISAVDTVSADQEYLEEAIPEILDALNISDYTESQ